MSWVSNKVVFLGGVQYLPGDIIPDGAIISSRIRALKTAGYISEIDEAAPVNTGVLDSAEADTAGKVTIPVILNGSGETAEVLGVQLSEGEVQYIFSILQMTADNAAAEIDNVGEEDTLIVLRAADSRKTVKSAAEKRLGQLSSTKDDKNEATGVNAISGDITETATQPDA